MTARATLWVVGGAIVIAIIGYSLWSTLPAHDVFLYLECRDIAAGRLQVTLLDDDNEPFYEQDFPLDDSCNQAALEIVKAAHTTGLSVTLQLYSADGKHLFTKKGSRDQGNILLDEKGFHVDLKLNGEPPGIAFHSL